MFPFGCHAYLHVNDAHRLRLATVVILEHDVVVPHVAVTNAVGVFFRRRYQIARRAKGGCQFLARARSGGAPAKFAARLLRHVHQCVNRRRDPFGGRVRLVGGPQRFARVRQERRQIYPSCGMTPTNCE
jgi:hypothetical protein